jgi:DNA-binding MarR family transcriptional regulator
MEERDHVQYVVEQWRRENPRLDRSAFAVIGRISRLARLLEDQHEPVLAAHGVNGGEFDVLAALRRTGRPYRLTPTALSKALMVTSGGMTKRLAALEGRGLIRREPDPQDGRSTAVSLTHEGSQLVDATLTDHVANQQRLLSGLERQDRAQLALLLEKLAVSLGDHAERRVARRRARRAGVG